MQLSELRWGKKLTLEKQIPESNPDTKNQDGNQYL